MAASITSALMLKEIRSIGQGKLLNLEIADLSDREQALVMAGLRALANVLEKRSKEVRDPLLDATKERGVEGEDAHIRYTLGETMAVAEYRQSKTPDEDKLKALLGTKDIPVTDVFDTVPTLVLNGSKLKFLLDTGKLNKTEFEGLFGSSYALKVEPSADLKEALKDALSVEVPDVTNEKPKRGPQRK